MTISPTKACSICTEVKPLEQFHARARSADGRQNKCAACAKEQRRQWRATKGILPEERAKAAARTRVWREQNDGRWQAANKAWAEANHDRQIEAARRFRQRNPNYERQRLASSPGLMAAYAAARRARLLQATPAWADMTAIRAVYERAKRLTDITGVEHHVDHIIPLKNKRVCGLHVAENLQILTADANVRKSNRFVIE